jgi:hypothetical protein
MGLAAAIASPKRTRTQDAGLKALQQSCADYIWDYRGFVSSRNSSVDRNRKIGEKETEVCTLKSRVIIHDPNWWKAMTDEEVDDLLEGRFWRRGEFLSSDPLPQQALLRKTTFVP